MSASKSGLRYPIADTSGPNSIRVVASAHAPSIVQHSKCLPVLSRPSGQKWSQVKTMSAPDSSTARQASRICA